MPRIFDLDFSLGIRRLFSLAVHIAVLGWVLAASLGTALFAGVEELPPLLEIYRTYSDLAFVQIMTYVPGVGDAAVTATQADIILYLVVSYILVSLSDLNGHPFRSRSLIRFGFWRILEIVILIALLMIARNFYLAAGTDFISSLTDVDHLWLLPAAFLILAPLVLNQILDLSTFYSERASIYEPSLKRYLGREAVQVGLWSLVLVAMIDLSAKADASLPLIERWQALVMGIIPSLGAS